MKQLAQYQDGRLELQEVPEPSLMPGGILVRTTCSVISPGTERMKVEQAKMSLLEKARARPDQVRKVLDTARTLGWKAAAEKVRNRLESPTPLGYSAAGVVVAVDALNTRFRVGDRVACGGAECAHHAEVIAVPDLLAAKVPEGVEDWQAAYTTLAAIAMQGVRQAQTQIGERVLVIGQGLVGLLTTKLLQIAGARVMAVDLNAARLEIAKQMGAERVASSNVENAVREWTSGMGVDAVLLCVGGKSAEVAAQAVACLRDRGTLVIVGMHEASLEWKTAFQKDITVRYSRSYGPGRYDTSYEWGGVDYPAGYVRWTENRNFEACLELMRSGRLDLKPVTTRKVAFGEVIQVYERLDDEIGVIIEYCSSGFSRSLDRVAVSSAVHPDRLKAGLQNSVATLDVIGAGNFVRTMLLPHVKGKIALGTVVNGTGLSARHVKEKFGFAKAATDFAEATSEAVIIGTRHDLHASLVLKALKAGKQVFVEKPLCLTEAELAEIDAAMAETSGSLMVGFNRRFAPATVEMKKWLDAAPGAKMMSYHVCAGVVAADHWYADPAQGGRIIGEACHMLDFACFMLGKPVRVSAQKTGTDSVSAQVEFVDGSTFQLLYSAEGDSAFPKESIRVFANGLVAECENFMRLTVWKNRKAKVSKHASKGHAEEMTAWLGFLKEGKPHPLPDAQARQGMRLTFAVLEATRSSQSVEL
ncbi:MAG: bi-domain-containing oxidoreductase [Verrucomicrobiaceae bacterium]|nr:bi-domain-containing oxidoreductase [Verrucomicrobiaceae bacterium]